jgi:hypothetical protein
MKLKFVSRQQPNKELHVRAIGRHSGNDMASQRVIHLKAVEKSVNYLTVHWMKTTEETMNDCTVLLQTVVSPPFLICCFGSPPMSLVTWRSTANSNPCLWEIESSWVRLRGQSSIMRGATLRTIRQLDFNPEDGGEMNVHGTFVTNTTDSASKSFCFVRIQMEHCHNTS